MKPLMTVWVCIKFGKEIEFILVPIAQGCIPTVLLVPTHSRLIPDKCMDPMVQISTIIKISKQRVK